jgi:hypothetical protein
MPLKHSRVGLLLAMICFSSSCEQSEQENLIGRWQASSGPNMIFRENGTAYSINRGARRKGRYYLDTETKPHTLIVDMRKTEINAVLYFDYDAFSAKHIQLTPTFVQKTGEKKKESELTRRMLFKKIDPNDPTMGAKRFAVKTTPEAT